MSGTSMDGIDAAVLASDGRSELDRGPSAFFPYDAAFRRRIEAALVTARTMRSRDGRPGDLAPLEKEITLRHAKAVRAFLRTLPERFARPALIGFHGQTVLHRPEASLTVQLGDGALLARETGIDVVSDMRANDMAHGGQGAPLVPAYHAALARNLPPGLGRPPIALVNIGGIANITYVGDAGDPVAFDCGPGNMLIDQWVARHAGVPFDQGGMIASEGGVNEAVAEAYLNDGYFRRPAPKSLDRGDFSLAPAEGLDLADGARTLAAVTARAIHRATEHLPRRPGLWILCGGGRCNPHIASDLAVLASADGARVIPAEAAGLDGDAMEAEAWAYLAVRSFLGLALTFPTTTGCRRPVTGGRLDVAPPSDPA
jgi:anhydro-N-acetylmuramic acid kinase